MIRRGFPLGLDYLDFLDFLDFLENLEILEILEKLEILDNPENLEEKNLRPSREDYSQARAEVFFSSLSRA